MSIPDPLCVFTDADSDLVRRLTAKAYDIARDEGAKMEDAARGVIAGYLAFATEDIPELTAADQARIIGHARGHDLPSEEVATCCRVLDRVAEKLNIPADFAVEMTSAVLGSMLIEDDEALERFLAVYLYRDCAGSRITIG